MKKLMFAMAAVAAGTVIADITSNNIVGYAGNELDTDYGAKYIAPQFVDVGSDIISLDKLTPKADEAIEDYAVEIQVLDNAGMVVEGKDYAWVGGEWKNSDGSEITTPVTFAAGQGLCVFCYAGETATSLQSSGEVSQEDVVVTLDTDYGCVLTANPFPVAVALADITPEADEAIEDYAVEIQVLDNAGMVVEGKDYAWVGGEWKNSDGSEITTPVTFAAGQGLCVFCYAGETPTYLRIPAPEL